MRECASLAWRRDACCCEADEEEVAPVSEFLGAMAPPGVGVGVAYLWGKGRGGRKGTPVVVTMESPNYSVVEVDGPDAEAELRAAAVAMDKGGGRGRSRSRTARQLTWVLLLRARRAAGRLASLAAAAARRFRRSPSAEAADELGRGRGRLMYGFIRGFLALSLLALAVELAAYWNGWRLRRPELRVPEAVEIEGWAHSAYMSWMSFRADYIRRPIEFLSKACILLFVIQSMDRLVLCLGCFWIKLRKIKPRIEGDPFREGSGYQHPMVLVQIPMCNEKEV